MENIFSYLHNIPTRRDIFSKEEALKYKELILQKLATMNITFVDIEDANDEGLLFDDNDVDKVVDKMIKEKVDALFFPHCNFGTEYLVAQVAKKMNLPILIWGPRDESPLGDGSRLRDSQCGLFATGKVLRRFRCKFTYLPMCRLEDQEFYEGIRRFLATVNIIKELKDLTILQIATRPSGFWTMMVNEGELLEKFNIKIHPVTLAEVKDEMDAVEQNKKDEVIQVIDYLKKETIIEISDEALVKVAALKVAIKSIAKRYNCKAAAVQCWNAMQGVLGIFPCAANALLTDEKFPVACETDIHGAITSIIAQAASIEDNVTFFADWTVPHPTNNNAELSQSYGSGVKPSIYLQASNTCWSAFTNINENDWKYYLQYRKRQGYNVLQINILPQWDASATDLNHSPYQKDEKGNYQFDKLNDSYFNHARSMCEVAKEYGFELALVVFGVIMYQRHGQIIC